MKRMRNVMLKSVAEIVAEWDALAPVRLRQILDGDDLTFNHILAPSILRQASRVSFSTAVDAGCGVGVLTNMLCGAERTVIGIDPSGQSVEIARKQFGRDCVFFRSTLEEFARKSTQKYDLVVANMVLMDVLDLPEFLVAAAHLLQPGGIFIFSITHPCFWPEYYGYSFAEWFDYKKDLIIETPFRITKSQDCGLVSTHVHRPLERYVEELSKSGFLLEQLLEPIPEENVRHLYPREWKYPRYLIGRCRLAFGYSSCA